MKLIIDDATLAAEGVTADTPVTLNLSQSIKARSVLLLVLSPHGLGHAIKGDAIVIRALENPEVYRKSYDLTRVADSADGIARVLREVVQKVRELEGKVMAADSRRVTVEGTSLIADQPQKVHEEIADLLYLVRNKFQAQQEEKQFAVRRKERNAGTPPHSAPRKSFRVRMFRLTWSANRRRPQSGLLRLV